jgi:hypothetical protein
MSTRAITTAAKNTADTVIAAVEKAMGDAYTGVLPSGQNASPG